MSEWNNSIDIAEQWNTLAARVAALEKQMEPPALNTAPEAKPKPSGWRAREWSNAVYPNACSVVEIHPSARRFWRCGDCWSTYDRARPHNAPDGQPCNIKNSYGWSEVIEIAREEP